MREVLEGQESLTAKQLGLLLAKLYGDVCKHHQVDPHPAEKLDDLRGAESTVDFTLEGQTQEERDVLQRARIVYGMYQKDLREELLKNSSSQGGREQRLRESRASRAGDENDPASVPLKEIGQSHQDEGAPGGPPGGPKSPQGTPKGPQKDLQGEV